jgi:cystathionine beta-lyase/cystathionine gamma-synthase
MSEQGENHRFGTKVIHAGQSPEPVTGAIMPPIFQTSTYVQPALGQNTGYEYARVQNPTREAWERSAAALENGTFGLAFASGLSAIECVIKRLSAGDHLVSEENTYGGTTRMLNHVISRLGIEITYVDSRDPDEVQAAMRANTKLVHVETPSNPLMRVCDIRRVAEVAHDGGAILMVDNTFASPFNQRPLEHGADVVMHSTTKYMNGHSDVLGGVLVVKDQALGDELSFIRKSTGAVPGPMDCWLCLRGVKTLDVRMRRHNENGQRVAEFLATHSEVVAVHYPGLPSHPQHALAKELMDGFSGMLAFEMKSPAAVKRAVEAMRIFQLAESLGGVESMSNVPSLMTHASVPADRREAMGITDSLIRLSVGIEDGDDLIADLEQALEG